jgi:hypothetical protein
VQLPVLKMRDDDHPAVAAPSNQNATAPVEGVDSFTEGRGPHHGSGYAEVSDLKLDDNGIWQAKATEDGKPVM